MRRPLRRKLRSFSRGSVLGFALLHLRALGREFDDAAAPAATTRWQRLARAPHHVHRGWLALDAGHRRHVHKNVRDVLYTAGAVLAFYAFFFEWGHLEAGAWLIQLVVIGGTEVFLWTLERR